MTRPSDGAEFSKLVVFGTTLVGKSTLVSTARSVLQESQPRVGKGYHHPRSNQERTTGYSIRLSNRTVEMVDTHGLAESLGTNAFRASLLRFLAETKKAAFYPPLILLQTLSEVEMELLRKINSIFSEIVVVFLQEDDSRLRVLRECIRHDGIRPIRAFHVQAFSQDCSSAVLNQRQKYDSDVWKIMHFYRTVTPSREILNFSSSLLAGRTRREMCSRREVKTEIVRRGRGNDDANEEDRRACLSLSADLGRLTAHLRAMRRANPAIAAIASIAAFVTHLGSAILGAIGSRRNEPITPVVTSRRTSQRRVYELWKLPDADIKIFMRYEYEQWRVVKEERLSRTFRTRRRGVRNFT